MTILAVTGLAKEAKIAGVAGVVAVAGGGDADGLMAKLNALHGELRGVISIGLAGALSTTARVGRGAGRASSSSPMSSASRTKTSWSISRSAEAR